MLNRLGIRTKLALVVALPLLATFVFAVFSIQTLQQVRIGGQRYAAISETKALIADILPPPQYLIEPYNALYQLAFEAEATKSKELRDRLDRMEREYRDGREQWAERLPDGELKTVLITDAFNAGETFWRLVATDFLPALDKADRPGMEKALNGPLKGAFDDHRASVLAAVDLAEEQNARQEAVSSKLAQSRRNVLAGLFLVTAIVALVSSTVVARSILKPVGKLRQAANDAASRLEAANLELDEIPTIEPVVVDTEDELKDTADSFNKLVHTTIGLIGNQARVRKNTAEMFVNLGRRNQNLVARQLKFIDQLERSETDPDLLASLFRLDYLATRMRRNAESLLVIAGLDSPRKWKRSVPVIDVARSAASESEQFERVEFGHFDGATVVGGAVANVVHLLAELIDNAVRYSPPDTAVTISGGLKGDAFVVGIADLGMGMSEVDLAAANARLRAGDSGEVPTAHLGLFVVSRLSDRHEIRVELENPGGDGLTAWVTLPPVIIEKLPGGPTAAGRAGGREAAIPPPPPISISGPDGGSVGKTGLAMRDPSSESLNLGRDRTGVAVPTSGRPAPGSTVTDDGSGAPVLGRPGMAPAGLGAPRADVANLGVSLPARPISDAAGDEDRPATVGGFRRRARANDPAAGSPAAPPTASPLLGSVGGAQPPTPRSPMGPPAPKKPGAAGRPAGRAAGKQPRSADAMRSRLDSFSFGKSLARKDDDEETPADGEPTGAQPVETPAPEAPGAPFAGQSPANPTPPAVPLPVGDADPIAAPAAAEPTPLSGEPVPAFAALADTTQPSAVTSTLARDLLQQPHAEAIVETQDAVATMSALPSRPPAGFPRRTGLLASDAPSDGDSPAATSSLRPPSRPDATGPAGAENQ